MILIVDHDGSWADQFLAEALRIVEALGSEPSCIHHIGSTAIPATTAKPIIDMLLEVNDSKALDRRSAALLELGYEAMGEFGIAGRRYFRRSNAAGVRTHHLHAFERGAPEIERHLAFRDYLRAHPGVAAEYAALKRRLVATNPNDMAHYVEGKAGFISEQQRKALGWARSSTGRVDT